VKLPGQKLTCADVGLPLAASWEQWEPWSGGASAPRHTDVACIHGGERKQKVGCTRPCFLNVCLSIKVKKQQGCASSGLAFILLLSQFTHRAHLCREKEDKVDAGFPRRPLLAECDKRRGLRRCMWCSC